MAEKEKEAIQLKNLAEKNYNATARKTALENATQAHRLCPTLPGLTEMLTAFQILNTTATSHQYYTVLGLENFSQLSLIKSQYKKLALILHPDKSSLKNASSEAFKLVNDAFHVLSDRVTRRAYDTKLRLSIQSTVADDVEMTFWTVCSRCELMHKFERKYVGFRMVCPNCNHGFKAVEVADDVDDDVADVSFRRSSRVRVRVTKMIFGEGNEMSIDRKKHGFGNERSRISGEGNKVGSKNGERKRGKEVERELTLAEMKSEARKKKKGEKIRENKRRIEFRLVEDGGMEVMTVEDSDFYDFDEDRVEKSFKKGQIWAIYDDDDGMPRHYGLIDEVVCVKPFRVKMSWLDFRNHEGDRLLALEGMGCRVSCGRFKVAREDVINLLNIFSHLVECERGSKELYRIYPKKGSVWAIYKEQGLGSSRNGGSSCDREETRGYDIVVVLTSYSEMHGLSMAYLEKVDGYKAVFKRREIGCHAIRWVEKDEFRLFSHQIPCRKLSENDACDLSSDCWELDPASLPSNLLGMTIRN